MCVSKLLILLLLVAHHALAAVPPETLSFTLDVKSDTPTWELADEGVSLIKIECIIDEDGSRNNNAFEDISSAAGQYLWRDQVNAEGGICISKNAQGCSRRKMVSLVAWNPAANLDQDAAWTATLDFHREVCSRPVESRPHLLLSPFSSGKTIQLTDAMVEGGCTDIFLDTDGAASSSLYSKDAPFLFGTLSLSSTWLSTSAEFFVQRGELRKIFQFSYTNFHTYQFSYTPPTRHPLVFTAKASKLAIIAKAGDPYSVGMGNGLRKTIESGAFGAGTTLVGKRCSSNSLLVDAPECASDSDCLEDEECVVPEFAITVQPSANFLQGVNWFKHFKDIGADHLYVSSHASEAIMMMEALEYSEWSPKAAVAGIPVPTNVITAMILDPQKTSQFWHSVDLFACEQVSGANGELYSGTTEEFCEKYLHANMTQYVPASISDPASLDPDRGALRVTSLVAYQRALERTADYSLANHGSGGFEDIKSTLDKFGG